MLMDFEWAALAMGDVAWIFVAFVLGLASRQVGMPPLVGFLAAGFLLNMLGGANGDLLQKLADLGITLLLFTVGLKLNLRTLARPQVWAVTTIHTCIVVAVLCALVFGLALSGVPLLSDLDLQSSLLIAFALSFSSTVFVVKALEDKGEIASLHGRIAIGILIMQDIAAVGFLALSTGKWPSLWALSLLLLIPLRPFLHSLLQRVGHGELLVIYGFLLALGGAEVFEMVGMKGDLGALILGVLIASHPKAEEMAKTMLGFKDLFLLGFFLSIGLSGQLTWQTFLVGALVVPLVLIKSSLFFVLLTRFKLRARTSLLATLNLSNYSEFGLIVAAIGVANGWIAQEWLLIIAVALSLSFAMSAGLNAISLKLYARHRSAWQRWQRADLLVDDRLLDVDGAKIAIIGMGGIGTGAYDTMRARFGETVIGIDNDPITASNQRDTGRNVLHGDASDADFWDRVQASHTLELIMLALPKVATNVTVLERLAQVSYNGRVAATAKFPDEVDALKAAGATTVFNIYTEAGAGFAAHVTSELPEDGSSESAHRAS